MSRILPTLQFNQSLFGLAVIAAAMMLAANAHAGTEKVLYSFTGGSDGYFSTTGVAMDSAGNIYGTTNFGGNAGIGTIYELTPSGGSYSYNQIHSFSNAQGNGFANSSLLLDSSGNLYGVAESGGAQNSGTIFELSPNGGSWSMTVLYTFRGGADGSVPEANLVMDAAGNLYGVTALGGDTTLCGGTGCGTVFELIHSGSGWTKQEIYRFKGGAGGSTPEGGLVFDASGNLYGTTAEQGVISTLRCPSGCGTVFKLSPPATGHVWTATILHRFNGVDGSTPVSAVVLDAAGNLYVATNVGGDLRCGTGLGCGTVVELSPAGSKWTSQVLHTFAGTKDGATPSSGLILDASGNVYGAVYSGGTHGWGQIFELSQGANGWTKTELYGFSNGADGADPGGPLVRDATGNIFGHTYAGGQFGVGAVFEVTP